MLAPSGAAVGGLEDEVGVVVRKATATFVHPGDVQGPATSQIACDLHVADEGTGVGHRYRRVHVAPLSVEKVTKRAP